MRGQIPSLFARIGAVLPLMPLELVVARLVANALAARPAFAARLADYAGRTFAIDPTDCPFCIAITLDGEGPVLDVAPHFPPTTGAYSSEKCPQPAVRVIRDLAEAPHDARVAAPLLVLLGMLDGTYDGDALFFARDLVIEGDTDAVLALRNALESAELDPATVIDLPSGLHGPFNRLVALALDGARRALGAPPPSGLPPSGLPPERLR